MTSYNSQLVDCLSTNYYCNRTVQFKIASKMAAAVMRIH